MFASRFNDQFPAALGKKWTWLLAWGVALVVLGGIAISAATMTTVISIVLLGALLLISGLAIIMVAFTFCWHKWRGFFLDLFLGILYLIAGIMLVKNPILASVSLTLFLGIFYLVIGVFRTIYSLSISIPNWGLNFFNGIISLVLGILILSSWPESSLYIIGLFVGIDLLFTGFTYMMASFAARALR